MTATGTIIQGETPLGIGFVLTPRVAVTAAHVLRGSNETSLSYVPDGAPPAAIERVRSNPGLDVAVLDLSADVPPVLGWAPATRNGRWELEARWLENDPLLTGHVTAVRRTIGRKGIDVEVIQLLVDQAVFDFHGYSGAPVIDDCGRVLGLLVEQVEDRRPRRGPMERKASGNVLYAVPIADVMEHFEIDTDRVSAPREPTLVRPMSAMDSDALSTEGHLNWSNRPPFPHAMGTFVDHVVFSPDGALLATAGTDKRVRVWRLAEDDELAPPLRHEDPVRTVIWSGDGKLLATASGVTATVTALPDLGVPVWQHTHDTELFDLAISPNGRFLATAGGPGVSAVWDLREGMAAELPRGIFGVAFNPNGAQLAAYGVQGVIHLWRFSADGRLERPIPIQAQGNVKQLMFSPSGRWLIVVVQQTTLGNNLFRQPQTAWLHDPVNGNRMWSVEHNDEINQVAITRDDRLIASASQDRTARIWPVGAATTPAVVDHEHVVLGVAFASAGEFLVVAGWEEGARVWRLEGNSAPERLPHDDKVRAVTVSRNDLIATASGHCAYVWDPRA